MAQYKLEVIDFEEDYELIAIHSQFEDFKIVYNINRILGLYLSKSKTGIIHRKGNVDIEFSKYEYEDDKFQIKWDLLQNKTSYVGKKQPMGLFLNSEFEVNQLAYLIPEVKKADYLLKIEGFLESEFLQSILHRIKTISGVQAVYTVDTAEIKSKNNLIF